MRSETAGRGLTVEVDSIPQQTQEKIAQIDSADLVVGVLADLSHHAVPTLCQGLRTLPGSRRILVLQTNPTGNPSAASAQTVEGHELLTVLPWSALAPQPSGAPMQSI